MKKALALTLCLCLLLSLLAGCGTEAPQGRYTLSSFSMDGVSYSLSELEALGVGTEIYIVFHEDHSGLLHFGSSEMDFTWDGSCLHSEEDEIDYRFEEDTVTLLYQGTEMVFQ
ncbi:MAG: hypothetical protein IJA48_06625 [Oscillospiraceae bacterium]|nr:hypothetical protein [Oscillospiraceae bacterium]